MILNKIKKNIQKLKSYGLPQETNAYRLYDRDIPEYPFMVDLYGDFLLVYDRQNEIIDKNKDNLPLLLEALKTYFPNKEIVVKRRHQQSRFDKYQKVDGRKKEFIIEENKAKFLINPYEYIDTGLFLDHRPLRKWIKKESTEKKVLNLFSYTCAISVSAGIGGAKEIHSVDLSSNYLNWGKKNFQVNNIPEEDHQFISGDILNILPSLENDQYDLIICDPPTFSNSKKMKETFDVQRDHLFLINECLKKMKQNGTLYFSCNKRDFKLDDSIKLKENIIIQDLTAKSIPPDFKDKKIHCCFKIRFK